MNEVKKKFAGLLEQLEDLKEAKSDMKLILENQRAQRRSAGLESEEEASK